LIVLDTHAWVWFLDDQRKLSARARRLVEREVQAGTVRVSSISVWEVAMLVDRGRLRLNRDVTDWLGDAERLPFIHFVPIDNRVALKSVHLPAPLHGDPADRFIVATALLLGASLVTKDARLLEYPHLETIW